MENQQQLRQWFDSIDVDRTGSLTPTELQRALVNGNWEPFNINTIQLLVRLFDRENVGYLRFNEFVYLWKYIADWKKVFAGFDADGSGTISFNELKQALLAFGYNLSDNCLSVIVSRYKRRGGNDVNFDNFIQICVLIRTFTESFKKYDHDQDGWVQINYDQFLLLLFETR